MVSVMMVLILILMPSAISQVSGQCPQNKYGPGCRYDCHCGPGVTCHPQTGCSGNCAVGWDGMSCQRQNVALRRPTSQTGTFCYNSNGSIICHNSGIAVNGRSGHKFIDTPCSQTQPGSQVEWTVTLDKVYNIYRFKIYNRDETGCIYLIHCGARLNWFVLSVGNTPTQNYRTCYEDTTNTFRGPGAIIQRTCNTDGPISGNKVRISLTTGQPLTLCEVLLYVCSAGWYGEFCERECVSTTNCLRCDVTGIRCQECVAGLYGEHCVEPCGHCWNNNACDKETGVCPETTGNRTCAAGYRGDKCTNNCIAGTYGADCKRCGSCAGGPKACNVTSGFCTSTNPKCLNGFQGDRCDQSCGKGTYGQNCSGVCGSCADEHTMCDTTSGNCQERPGLPRCKTGYSGSRCDQESSRLPPVSSGLIGGGIVLAVVAVVVIVLLYRRRHQKRTKKTTIQLLRHNDVDLRDEHIERQPSDDRDIEEDDVEIEVNQVANEDPYEIQVSKYVPIEEFSQYVARKKLSGMYKTEFDKFPAGLQAKHDAADLPVNKEKSRYRNLVAYDHSRVMLRVLRGIDETDYINACYVNGYNEPKKFIASQGPADPIINDFMRMLWEQKVGKVIMVTNLVEARKEKCLQYWPNEGSKRFGVIQITLLVEEEYANFVIRTLQLTHAKKKNKTMTIKQFHFTTWPDHGVPVHATPLLEFREKVFGYKAPVNGPIVVHCSAGIGRTGTFIALDYLINQADVEEQVDVPGCVFLLRKQRVNMIQTEAQHEFLHEALVESLTLSRGAIPSVNFFSVYKHLSTVSPVTGKTKMAKQFKALTDITPKLNKAKLTAALNSENKSKNRSNKILAADNCRPFLSTPVAGCNNYINAVFLPSYKLKRGYILSQTPLPKTVVDFWRLVYEHSISTIVMLDTVETGDKNVGDYLPDKKGKYDSFEVEVTEMEDQEAFSVCTYQLFYKNTKVAYPIKHFRCKFWSEDPSPESIPSVLTVIEKSEAWQQRTGNEPILVYCRDGVSKSGLYCTAATVIERLKIDQEVNILQTIKQMRINRPEIIGDLYQFHFLHQIVMGYLEGFGTYANFS